MKQTNSLTSEEKAENRENYSEEYQLLKKQYQAFILRIIKEWYGSEEDLLYVICCEYQSQLDKIKYITDMLLQKFEDNPRIMRFDVLEQNENIQEIRRKIIEKMFTNSEKRELRINDEMRAIDMTMQGNDLYEKKSRVKVFNESLVREKSRLEERKSDKNFTLTTEKLTKEIIERLINFEGDAQKVIEQFQVEYKRQGSRIEER